MLSDGFGMGITLLMALTGLSALDILHHCRQMLKSPDQPSVWVAPGVPDANAGDWPTSTVSEVIRIVDGLSYERDKEDRLPLTEALQRIEALVDVAPPAQLHVLPWDGNVPGVPSTAAITKAPAAPNGAHEIEEPRLCIICDTEPRSVRFRCGHAVCCLGCVPRVQGYGNTCPQCRTPLGTNPVAEVGAHVQLQATFQLACPTTSGARAGAAAAGRGGRGGRRGRGGRGWIILPFG